MSSDHGSGDIAICLSGPRRTSRLRRCRTRSPLKILTPQRESSAQWIVQSSLGGGLVGGDRLALCVHAEAGTRTLLTTQASTKVYKNTAERPSAQTLDVMVGANAFLASLPDPVVCFRDASFVQQTRFSLHASANLVACESLSAGREAFGERWAFRRYASAFVLERGGQPVLEERVLLDPAHGDLAARLHGCAIVGVLVISGPELEAQARALLERCAQLPAGRERAALHLAVSPLRDGSGVIARFSASTLGPATALLRRELGFVAAWLGDDPFTRK